MRNRSTGSTISSARKRSRTSWPSASPTACSSRSGTATASTTCRSPCRRRSAWSTAAGSTKSPARCATWCRTTCSSCWPWWRWSRPPASTPSAVRNRKADVFAALGSVQPEDAVRGQYGPGTVLGRDVAAYRGEPDVAPNSDTETYRRHAPAHRQLALGRRALLPAHRQAHGRADDGNRHPLQAGTLCAVRRHPCRGAAAQLAGAAHPAERGDLLAVRGEAARPRGGPRRGADGVPLRRLVPARAECRLRNADLRRHDRRPDSVQPRRHDRGDLAGGAAGAGRLGRRTAGGIFPITPPAPMARTPPRPCCGRTAAPGGR